MRFTGQSRGLFKGKKGRDFGEKVMKFQSEGILRDRMGVIREVAGSYGVLFEKGMIRNLMEETNFVALEAGN